MAYFQHFPYVESCFWEDWFSRGSSYCYLSFHGSIILLVDDSIHFRTNQSGLLFYYYNECKVLQILFNIVNERLRGYWSTIQNLSIDYFYSTVAIYFAHSFHIHKTSLPLLIFPHISSMKMQLVLKSWTSSLLLVLIQ